MRQTEIPRDLQRAAAELDLVNAIDQPPPGYTQGQDIIYQRIQRVSRAVRCLIRWAIVEGEVMGNTAAEIGRLPRFEGRCPKCGNENVKVSYELVGDIVQVACGRCLWAGHMQPMDSGSEGPLMEGR